METLDKNSQEFKNFINELVIRILSIANLNPEQTKGLFSFLLEKKMISENFNSDDLKISLSNLFSENPMLGISLLPPELRDEFISEFQTEKLRSEGGSVKKRTFFGQVLTGLVLINPVYWLTKAQVGLAKKLGGGTGEGG